MSATGPLYVIYSISVIPVTYDTYKGYINAISVNNDISVLKCMIGHFWHSWKKVWWERQARPLFMLPRLPKMAPGHIVHGSPREGPRIDGIFDVSKEGCIYDL